MRKFWTETELQYLRDHYPNTKTDELAKVLGRSYGSISCAAVKLGLKKSEEFMNSELSGRMHQLTNMGAEFRFKKGQHAWNKGMKGLQIGGVETRFKKGNLPHNTRSDGEIGIRNCRGFDYKWVRTSLGKWDLLHRVVWREHNGEIPKGMVIVFKDGDSMNCEIGNLEMITMAENMKRNSIMNYPPEMIEVMRLKGTLNKVITHRNGKK